ncbi:MULTISPECIES: RICIN domain-containing protein [unclassified Streptomyces]|uniref:RICIN domain-containing protein n=1 Tax=unclassified Streptomyces TaxID=2593676 RepID=UPI002ED0B7B4|nr:RICIN domain-containing protein [Streptomyces sp. NBC_00891]WSY09957.1 RICIN domain-containing protein [Streptomyces sp. NBC_00890]WSZ11579.1 RICIN domain-containing protein [Streptomyces sp. NBC_00869]WSZ27438.1 RICIN domain-containing protein [Streptomyces sp. NBC_00870]
MALSASLAAAGALVALGSGTAGAATPGALTNTGNGKCLDVTDGSTADGTPAQMWTCYPGSQNQSWTLNSDGSLTAKGKCLDLAANGTANGTAVHLWTCYGSVASQKWRLTSAGDLVNTAANKCLDIKDNSSADGARLQIWDCAGTGNQKWSFSGAVDPTDPTDPPTGNNPDLGPNTVIFDPSMSASSIQSKLNSIFSQQQSNQFGSQRYAVLFKPGTYSADVNVGFYTQVAGLGLSPDAVNINGAVHAEADWFQGNATQNFWRDAENLSVTPNGGSDRWAVSQAAPYRRMHVRGNLKLDDGGWSSGGFISDSKIDGQIQSGSQQQFLTKNTKMGSWSGSNWNMVFVGDQGAPAQSFPTYTTVASAPVNREKPFLYVDDAGAWKVFVPAAQTNASATTWSGKTQAGSSLPLDDFYIAKPGASAADMNAALGAGKNLLITPGVYHLNQTLNVTRPDTVVLGMGLATLIPDNGTTALTTADVDGIKIAGVLVDAGTTNSQTLMRIGPDGSSANHAANPVTLNDVFFRIGGATVGKATQSLVVNTSNTIIDHTWIWRADHGNGGTVGWNTNTADTGLVVNGQNVTAYGLFVEHYQKTQVIWNGNGGRTYFFQNELPYDPPNQSAWKNGNTNGYPAYKVGASVTSHEAWGLGSYAYFNVNPSVVEDHSFEVPQTSGVKFHDMVTVVLGGAGTISHIINGTGAAVTPSSNVAYLTTYP